ncbi:hypothetical protein M406DRAFT_263163 [Cryphonectria parasitica EP155]|uniref:NACHT domain-containing protein n=1 Tax=Cryphonectria parasitica (strain ATCC 38755 / EP155) TaxID=660469 RepID=A0A9P4XX62_CRYP1|nr:uncharacterized protein M406DRAFT_263163 [Cryphonectria parasitica EP155]KAF3762569.1 hypothetical protein M406DRAFT_263163 [Cryphonectria parasitica EP155]
MTVLTKLQQIISSLRKPQVSDTARRPAHPAPTNQQKQPEDEAEHASSTSKSAPPPATGSEPTQAFPPKDANTSIRELWHIAYEKLREEEKELVVDYEAKLCGDLSAGLASTVGHNIGVRDRMETILQRKMSEVNRDVWKLKFGSSELPVQDLVQPVLAAVDWANDYISDALSANPYASIAWGGVSLFLPLLLNPSKQGASMAKGLEYISSLLAQSRMWEDLYVRRYEPETAQKVSSPLSHVVYKDALEKLYRQILRFQVEGYCYYAHNAAFRLGLDTIQWNEWDSLLDKIREQKRVFSAVNKSWRDMKYDDECSATDSRHREAMSHWQSIGTDISGLRKEVRDFQAEEKRDKLLQWLCSIDPSENYNAARDKHENGTGDWLLRDSEEFKTWRMCPGSLLWLHGKAGSGKSILSSSVVKHLRERCASAPETALAYFFFSFSDLEKQKVDGMLASLVKQLYTGQHGTLQQVKVLAEYMEKHMRPDTKTLESILLAMAREFSATFVVIDALDECPARNGERKKLLNSLSSISRNMPDTLHILCTSRAEPDIETGMSTVLSPPSRAAMDLTAHQEGLDHDIRLYIDSILASAEYSSWPDDVKGEAKASLIKKADGM